MGNGAIVTKNGKNAVLDLAFAGGNNTAFSRMAIGTGTNTPVETDTDLQTKLAAWNGGSDYKNYLSGYPTFDTANKRVTVRMKVLTTQANGNSLTEVGDFNTDGTPTLFGRHVHDAITKNNGISILYEIIYEVE